MKYITFTLVATLASFAQAIPLSENSPKAPIEFRSELLGKRGKVILSHRSIFYFFSCLLLIYEIGLKSDRARYIDLPEAFKNLKWDVDEMSIKRDVDKAESENVKQDI